MMWAMGPCAGALGLVEEESATASPLANRGECSIIAGAKGQRRKRESAEIKRLTIIPLGRFTLGLDLHNGNLIPRLFPSKLTF